MDLLLFQKLFSAFYHNTIVSMSTIPFAMYFGHQTLFCDELKSHLTSKNEEVTAPTTVPVWTSHIRHQIGIAMSRHDQNSSDAHQSRERQY